MRTWYETAFWDAESQKLNILLSPHETLTPSKFLSQFSNTYSLIDDAWLDAYVRYCQNSKDNRALEDLEYVESKVLPRFENVFTQLKQTFLERFSDTIEYKRLRHTFSSSLEPFSEANTNLNTQERELIRQYDELRTSIKVDYDEGISTYQAWNLIESNPNQEDRKQIYLKLYEAKHSIANQTNRILAELIILRKQQAKNSGYSDYAHYSWLLRDRTDYSYQESLSWSTSLAKVFVSSYALLIDKLKTIHDVKSVYAWDLPPAPKKDTPISAGDYKQAIKRALGKMDLDFERIIIEVDEAGDMDIMHRPNKAGGNFGYGFKLGKRVGISGNSLGSISDLPTLLHECGHAIHFLYSNEQTLSWQQEVPAEIAELVAYIFQFVGCDILTNEGFIPASKDAQFKLVIAEKILDTFRGVAERDSFEQAIYCTDDTLSADQLGSKFMDVRVRPPYSEDGLEVFLPNMWQSYSTIITKPFSGIEYSLAWLGTLLTIDLYRKNPTELIENLKILMAKGSSISLSESYRLLGINFPFEEQDFEKAKFIFEREFLN